tara:strand:- start:106 stop:564 length:459 start_codon:yes stop_codon:yes gene_type:complete
LRQIEIREDTHEVVKYPEDMYCVYFHKDPETDNVVYVGKGTLHRAYQITNRGYDHHIWLLDKLSVHKIQDVVVIKGGQMTDKEATVVESHEIKCCLRNGCDLFNVTHNPFRKTRRNNAEHNRVFRTENYKYTAEVGSKAGERTQAGSEAVSI